METIKSWVGCGGKARKRRRGASGSLSSSDSDAESTHTHTDGEQAPTKVSLYDAHAMRRTLDEHVATMLEDASALVPSKTMENIRLLIMVLAVVAGIVAHVYPSDPVSGATLLAVCVAVYFGLSGVWQIHVWYIEREALFISKVTPEQPLQALVRSNMEKFSDKFELIVEAPAGKRVWTVAHSVGKFFTEVRHHVVRTQSLTRGAATRTPKAHLVQEGVFVPDALENIFYEKLLPALTESIRKKKNE